MFATTSPRMLPRRLSTGSYNSNPDADIDENEDDNYIGGRGLRPPSPHPMAHLRPPRESFVRQSLADAGSEHPRESFVRRSLVDPGTEPPRESFIPYSAFGYHEPQPQLAQPVSRERSYVDVDENMEIDPFYDRQNVDDEEFARRGNPTPRPSRLWRFARAFLRPFRFVKSAIRMPRFLRRKRSESKRSGTRSSDWDFRDPTPAPTSIRMQLSNEGGDNVTMVFPAASTAPVTILETNTDHGRDVRSETESHSTGATHSAYGHSASHHSHVSGRSPSHRSAQSHRGRNKANEDVLRATGTTRTTRTSFPPFSPSAVHASTIKESSRGQSSRTYSSMSRGSSLLHHVVRLYEALCALYHLPWVAVPPRRVAVDFIPALGSRSKYCVHRGPPQVPPAVLIAAAAAKNMEPSDGKSWYRPSPQQLEKQLRRRKVTNRHHTRSHSLANPYQQVFPDDPRFQQRQNTLVDSQPMFMYSPTMPPFPQPGSPYGTQPFYMVPGPPPPPSGPPHISGAGGGGDGGGFRAPPPARPPSGLSFAPHTSRPGPRPVQNTPGHNPTNSDNTNADVNAGRGEIQRTSPAAQPMYMIIPAPPGPPLPPTYGNMYSYPYSPPWTPPQRL